MRASIVANAVNIALDAVLILGLDLRRAGRRDRDDLRERGGARRARVADAQAPRDARRHRRALADVWGQGVPNGLQFVMEVGAFLILTILVARMSATDGAAHQLVLHLINVSFLPAHALAEARGRAGRPGRGSEPGCAGARGRERALALGAGYASACLVAFAVLGGTIVHAMAAADAALATRATCCSTSASRSWSPTRRT